METLEEIEVEANLTIAAVAEEAIVAVEVVAPSCFLRPMHPALLTPESRTLTS